MASSIIPSPEKPVSKLPAESQTIMSISLLPSSEEPTPTIRPVLSMTISFK
ncbi:MAG: hypothetical protein ACD_21C00139G0001 [uncultured bacterium]|nr:MAG: hypothetical protein ACD_21C00139G0001 [uncultured bacterium]